MYCQSFLKCYLLSRLYFFVLVVLILGPSPAKPEKEARHLDNILTMVLTPHLSALIIVILPGNLEKEARHWDNFDLEY